MNRNTSVGNKPIKHNTNLTNKRTTHNASTNDVLFRVSKPTVNDKHKTSTQIVIENVVRFTDAYDDVMANFDYPDLLIPKNLLFLLGMNEVNGYKKNGKFAHFTNDDNFIQYNTGIVLGDVDEIYISTGSSGSLTPLHSIIDSINRGDMLLRSGGYDPFTGKMSGTPILGKVCNVHIIKENKWQEDNTTYVYQHIQCTITRFTNYYNNDSYYTDDDLAKIYRAFIHDYVEEIPPEVIDELQKELSAMCDYITK